MTHHADLFASRELAALCTFSDLGAEACPQSIDGVPEYADAVATHLAFVPNREADLGNASCRWETVTEGSRQLFEREAVS